MALSAETRLGPYEILAPLGAGGMGEVYRARDTKLGREVAIKVLPSEVTQDSERLARFQREAHLLASLNHPHIAAIYGLEEVGDKPFLVLELVEGEDLAERLKRGPIPVDEALEIAQQVAEALEEAHAKGIVHRDLKPANVKLTSDGKVKVLDFGLAKAWADDSIIGSSSDLSQSPTLAASGTQAGVILGTAAYMSPEQASGKPVDKRADIWAFGVVLFEMLAGRLLFTGDTASEVLASVIKDEPSWKALPGRATPAAVRRLLERCLEKNPRNRLRDMGDARLELAAASAEPLEQPSTVPPGPFARRALPWALAVLGLALAVAGLLVPRSSDRQSLRPMTRATIVLPPEAPLAPSSSFYLSAGSPTLALAPDGSALVYVALIDDTRKLYRRDMRTGDIEPMLGTEDAQGPFFSPNSQWVGFFAFGKLKKVLLAGGEPLVLADAIWGFGGDWGGDGFIYFGPTEAQGVHRVPAAGGTVESVTIRAPDTLTHAWPALIPGTEDLLVTRLQNRESIALAKVGGKEPPMVVVERGSAGRVTPTGHLVFALEGRFLAAPYDRDAMRVTDSPTVLFDDIRTEDLGASQAAWSNDGTLVYVPGSDVAAGRFVWIDREGNRDPVGLPTARYGAFAVSPDGSTLAYSAGEDEWSIWLYDLERRGAPRLLTPGTQGGQRREWNLPVWAEDGEALYAGLLTSKGYSAFRIPIDAAARAPVEVIPPQAGGVEIAPDGLICETSNDIAYVPYGEEAGTLRLDQSRPIVASPEAQEIFPALSPDARWLTYMSDESGSWEIYVTSFPDAGIKRRVSFAGGEEPRWSPNGRKILYRFGSKWYSVAFADEPELTLGQPTLLFEGPFVNVPGYSWDMSPDGERFLVIENPDAGRPLTELVVVSNFFDGLRRLTAEGGE